MSRPAQAVKPRAAAQRKARRFALQNLYEWDMTGNPAHEIEARTRAVNHMHTVDLVHYHQLLIGVIREQAVIDELINRFSNRPLSRLDRVELAALRVGIYEMLQHPEIPFRVLIDETIDLVKHFGATDSFNFINGVLDKIAREVRPVEVQHFQKEKPASH